VDDEATCAHIYGVYDGDDNRRLSHAAHTINLGACEDFAVMAGAAATCAGSFDCDIIGGFLGVHPGTSHTGLFVGDISADSAGCATDGLAAWNEGTLLSYGTSMLAEMGGVTFVPGVYIHESSINIGLASPLVYLDALGDPNAEFIFNVGSTLTTCANSKIVLLNGARKENVFWVLGTALTMGADSILVGTVLAGSAITIGSRAMIMGRAIAQTAVTCETDCTIETSGRHSASPSAGPTAYPTDYPTPTPAPSSGPVSVGVAITRPGEAYGHHGRCSGFNQCGDAATCALAACVDQGYTELVSYGDAKSCRQFNVCHLFYRFNSQPCNLHKNWGNWCDVAGVTDIVCKNPGGVCSA
jgi:hypothetical protein